MGRARRTGFWCTLALTLLGLGLTPDVQARSFYVSPSGDDAAAGSMTSPWRTFAKASSGLQPGDTVNFRAGTYNERFIPEDDGAPGNPIVYRSYPGEVAIISGVTDGDLTIMAFYRSYLVVEGFTVRNQNYYRFPGKMSYWVQLEGNYITFRRNRVIVDGDVYTNVYVLNANSRGIVVAGKHVTVEHCFIRGQVIGIMLAGGSPRWATIRNDTVHATGQNNIDVGGTDDSSINYHASLIESCVLDTSIIEDNIQFEPDYSDPSSTLHNRGTIIRNCIMGNAIENSVDLKGAGHTIIENNLVYSSSGDDDGPIGGHDVNSGAGIETSPTVPTRYTIVRGNVIWDHSTGLTMAEGDHYYNNTILNNRRTWEGSDQTSGNHTCLRAWNYPAVDRVFLNNIVGGMPTGTAFDWRMDWGDKFTLDNNLYFERSGPLSFLHRVNGSIVTVRGLQEWRDGLASYGGYGYMKGKDQNSLEADPLFVNAPDYPTGNDPAWDFHVRAGSPVIDAGRPVAYALSAGANSTNLEVNDAYFFCDGFDITDGDLIKIGASAAVRITGIDYSANVITLAEPRNWSAGEGVHLDFWGANPDIGALEYTGTSQPPVPDQPTLTGPDLGSTNVDLNVVLYWDRANNAASYELLVATTPTFDAPVIARSGITALSFTARNLADNMTHYWRVRSANGVGTSDWSETRWFTTLKLDSVPPPPTTQSPTDGEAGISTNPHFSWSSIANAQSYRFQLSRNPNFLSMVQDISGVAGTSVDVTGLLNSTTYYWRVNASSAKGPGPWSLIATLTTFALPPNLGSEGIGNGNFTNGTSDWSFYTNGVATFTVTGPGFRKSTSGKVLVTQPGTNTQLYQSNLVLSPDSTYRLSFVAYSSMGNDIEVSVGKTASPFTSYGLMETVPVSTAWMVFMYEFKPKNIGSTVNDARLRFGFEKFGAPGEVFSLDNIRFQAVNPGTPPPPETMPVDYELEPNFPNPFNPATTIRYAIPADTQVRLEVYNILGQRVLLLVDAFQRRGTYNVHVDMSGQGSGVYFYTLHADAYRQTRKLLLLK
jgi:hypothetical protein